MPSNTRKSKSRESGAHAGVGAKASQSHAKKPSSTAVAHKHTSSSANSILKGGNRALSGGQAVANASHINDHAKQSYVGNPNNGDAAAAAISTTTDAMATHVTPQAPSASSLSCPSFGDQAAAGLVGGSGSSATAADMDCRAMSDVAVSFSALLHELDGWRRGPVRRSGGTAGSRHLHRRHRSRSSNSSHSSDGNSSHSSDSGSSSYKSGASLDVHAMLREDGQNRNACTLAASTTSAQEQRQQHDDERACHEADDAIGEVSATERLGREFLLSFGRLSQFARALRPQRLQTGSPFSPSWATASPAEGGDASYLDNASDTCAHVDETAVTTAATTATSVAPSLFTHHAKHGEAAHRDDASYLVSESEVLRHLIPLAAAAAGLTNESAKRSREEHGTPALRDDDKDIFVDCCDHEDAEAHTSSRQHSSSSNNGTRMTNKNDTLDDPTMSTNGDGKCASIDVDTCPNDDGGHDDEEANRCNRDNQDATGVTRLGHDPHATAAHVMQVLDDAHKCGRRLSVHDIRDTLTQLVHLAMESGDTSLSVLRGVLTILQRSEAAGREYGESTHPDVHVIDEHDDVMRTVDEEASGARDVEVQPSNLELSSDAAASSSSSPGYLQEARCVGAMMDRASERRVGMGWKGSEVCSLAGTCTPLDSDRVALPTNLIYHKSSSSNNNNTISKTAEEDKFDKDGSSNNEDIKNDNTTDSKDDEVQESEEGEADDGARRDSSHRRQRRRRGVAGRVWTTAEWVDANSVTSFADTAAALASLHLPGSMTSSHFASLFHDSNFGLSPPPPAPNTKPSASSLAMNDPSRDHHHLYGGHTNSNAHAKSHKSKTINTNKEHALLGSYAPCADSAYGRISTEGSAGTGAAITAATTVFAMPNLVHTPDVAAGEVQQRSSPAASLSTSSPSSASSVSSLVSSSSATRYAHLRHPLHDHAARERCAGMEDLHTRMMYLSALSPGLLGELARHMQRSTAVDAQEDGVGRQSNSITASSKKDDDSAKNNSRGESAESMGEDESAVMSLCPTVESRNCLLVAYRLREAAGAVGMMMWWYVESRLLSSASPISRNHSLSPVFAPPQNPQSKQNRLRSNSDKSQSNSNTNSNGTVRMTETIRQEMRQGLSHIHPRIHHELRRLSGARLLHMIDSVPDVALKDTHDVYNVSSAVGCMLLFATLPLPVLQRVCRELSLHTPSSAAWCCPEEESNTHPSSFTREDENGSSHDVNSQRGHGDGVMWGGDVHVQPLVMAERIGNYLYPTPDGAPLSLARLPFLPRFQVHEHAPGSYTCTVDNATTLGYLNEEHYLSNRFTCAKVKWHAMMRSASGRVSLQMWHHDEQESWEVHAVVRTSVPKRRKGGRGGDAANRISKVAAEVSVGEGVLFAETHARVMPGGRLCLEGVLPLDVARGVAGATTAGALPFASASARLYNAVEDRLVFHLALTATPAATAPAPNSKNDGNKSISTAAQVDSRSVSADESRAANNTRSTVVPTGKNNSKNASPANTNNGSKSNNNSKAVNKAQTGSVDAAQMRNLEKALSHTEAIETASRRELAEEWRQRVRQMQVEESRAAQKVQQRVLDRERKELLAKVSASPELIKEVERATQALNASRQVVNRLTRDRAREVKEVSRVRALLEDGRSELKRLHDTMESNTAVLAGLEEELRLRQVHLAEKKRRRVRREQRRGEGKWLDLKRVLDYPSTHHDTLAIDDFGSFLTSLQGSNGGGSGNSHNSKTVHADGMHSTTANTNHNSSSYYDAATGLMARESVERSRGSEGHVSEAAGGTVAVSAEDVNNAATTTTTTNNNNSNNNYTTGEEDEVNFFNAYGATVDLRGLSSWSGADVTSSASSSPQHVPSSSQPRTQQQQQQRPTPPSNFDPAYAYPVASSSYNLSSHQHHGSVTTGGVSPMQPVTAEVMSLSHQPPVPVSRASSMMSNPSHSSNYPLHHTHSLAAAAPSPHSITIAAGASSPSPPQPAIEPLIFSTRQRANPFNLAHSFGGATPPVFSTQPSTMLYTSLDANNNNNNSSSSNVNNSNDALTEMIHGFSSSPHQPAGAAVGGTENSSNRPLLSSLTGSMPTSSSLFGGNGMAHGSATHSNSMAAAYQPVSNNNHNNSSHALMSSGGVGGSRGPTHTAPGVAGSVANTASLSGGSGAGSRTVTPMGFGTIAPSPFSTNPVAHGVSSLYNSYHRELHPSPTAAFTTASAPSPHALANSNNNNNGNSGNSNSNTAGNAGGNSAMYGSNYSTPAGVCASSMQGSMSIHTPTILATNNAASSTISCGAGVRLPPMSAVLQPPTTAGVSSPHATGATPTTIIMMNGCPSANLQQQQQQNVSSSELDALAGAFPTTCSPLATTTATTTPSSIGMEQQQRAYDCNPTVVVGSARAAGSHLSDNNNSNNMNGASATVYEPLSTSTPSHFAFTVTAGPALPMTSMMGANHLPQQQKLHHLPTHVHVGLSPSSMSPSVSVSPAPAAAPQHRPCGGGGGASGMSLYHVGAMDATSSGAGATGSGSGANGAGSAASMIIGSGAVAGGAGTSSPSATNSSSGGPNSEQQQSHLFGMMPGMGTSPHPPSLPASLLFVGSGADLRMGGGDCADGQEYNFSWSTNM